MNTNRYCIPIYLNDKIVMDLLAIFEDGFSNVRQLKTYGDTMKAQERNIDANIGVSDVLGSLLGVSLSGGKKNTESNSAGQEDSVEKVHTNVSLFSKLRDRLIDEELIIDKSEIDEIVLGEGQFIELTGALRINPMIETLSTFIQVYEMAMRLSNEAELGNKTAMKAKKKEEEAMIKQIKALLDDMTKSETQDLLLTTDTGVNVILPSHIDRFIGKFDSDLYDGTFKILGKVIKVIDEDATINLFRKTSFKVFSESFLVDFVNQFNTTLRDAAEGGIDLPEVDSLISGPGAIVIPIGIYT